MLAAGPAAEVAPRQQYLRTGVLPPDYIGSDRLRLEAYRRLAAASDTAGVDRVIEELVDRYGPLPEPAQRLIAVARLRLLCREYGVTEVSTVSDSTLKVAPLPLLDSGQLRLSGCIPVRRTGRRCRRCRLRFRVPAVGWAHRASAISNCCKLLRVCCWRWTVVRRAKLI